MMKFRSNRASYSQYDSQGTRRTYRRGEVIECDNNLEETNEKGAARTRFDRVSEKVEAKFPK